MAHSYTAKNSGPAVIIELFKQPLRHWDDCLPDQVEVVARDAQERVAAHLAGSPRSAPAMGLVCGNARLVALALQMVIVRSLVPGRRFVEWGSGLGGAACVASALGFEALGIDTDPAMVEAGRTLAAAHGLSACFARESYTPDWALAVADGDVALRRPAAWAEADIVHVYPWPAEVRLVERLFLALAPDAALLLSTYGPAEVRVHRKVDLDGSGRYAARRG